MRENARSSGIDGDDTVDGVVARLVEVRREIAALQARETRLLAAAAELARRQAARPGIADGGASDIPLRSIAAQIAAACRTSDRSEQARIDRARILAADFPHTLVALGEGRISSAHARLVVDEGLPIDEPRSRAAFEGAALAVAERECVGRARPVVRRLAERQRAESVDDRHRRARADRRVYVRDLDDGMAELGAILPAVLAHGIHDRLTELARADIDARSAAATAEPLTNGAAAESSRGETPTAAPDRRGMDALRADALTDLLLASATSPDVLAVQPETSQRILASVQVLLPAATLVGAGVADGSEPGLDPAELVGVGPIDARTARGLAATAPGWDRLFTDPATGGLVAVDRYQPTSHQRRWLRARDEHCRFPGCRQAAARCDVDHTIARAHDGPTDLANLAFLCRRHHTLKHASAWRVRQLPRGVLEWTSPTGRVYSDAPPHSLVFTADAPSPADTTTPAPF